MSEVYKLNRHARHTPAFWLSNVSMLALMIAAAGGSVAEAANDNVDHPTVWIELGGQIERQSGQSSPFMPAFVVNNPDLEAFANSFVPRSQKAPPFGNGPEGSLSFQPNGSDWVFSAALRYGRSSGETKASQLPKEDAKFKIVLPPQYYVTCYCYGTHNRTSYDTRPSGVFGNVASKTHQSHMLLDFQAGKDVGLGFLGTHSSSVLNFGVRIAQFSSRTTSTVHAIPKVHTFNAFGNSTQFYAPSSTFRSYSSTGETWHNFHGVGPSLSWKASAVIAGHEDSMSLNFDGGVNGALLFGRQRAGAHHETSAYYKGFCNCTRYPTYVHSHDANRSRSVAIPNIGAFAGMSLKFPNAKVSLGYRGDFFLGAMDVGIDARKTKTVGYYGPYASVSIGLGG